MNHEKAEDENLAERYALGRLLPEDQLLFEEHLIDCPQCQDAVEASDRLRDGLHVVAAQDAAGLPKPRPLPTAGRPAWRERWPYAAAVAGLLALPAGLLWLQIQSVRRERDALRQEAATAEGRQAEQAAALDQERAARTEAEARLTRSQAGAPVFTLPLTRGAPMSPADAPPIRLPASPQWIVLALERDEASPQSTYRATLSAEGDRVVWQAQDLKPTSRDLLAVSLHSSLLHAGPYLVKLEELDPRNRVVATRHYPFRIVVR